MAYQVLDNGDASEREQIALETEWVITGNAPLLTPEQIEAVGAGKLACPKCNGRRYYLIPVKGKTTGFVTSLKHDCNCREIQRFFTRWNAMIPVAYRKFNRLEALQPSRDSKCQLTKQAEVLDALQAHPDRSCLFVGPPGYSKTVFSTALFSHALKQWAREYKRGGSPDSCWFISAYDLVQQAQDYVTAREIKSTDADGNSDTREALEPLVSVRKIREAVAAGLKPRLFIEELDKLPHVTEFRGSTIFELVKEIDAQGGQLVVTSNLSAADLAKMYQIRDGEALVRRFTDGNATGDGRTFDLFN